jgi:hypothetical protein
MMNRVIGRALAAARLLPALLTSAADARTRWINGRWLDGARLEGYPPADVADLHRIRLRIEAGSPGRPAG